MRAIVTYYSQLAEGVRIEEYADMSSANAALLAAGYVVQLQHDYPNVVFFSPERLNVRLGSIRMAKEE